MTELVCIVCPRGCMLKVDGENVSNNMCNRGVKYALEELNNPKRIITSSIEVKNGNMKMVSVKTNKYVPKNQIYDIIKEIRKISLEAPIEFHQVIIKDCLGITDIIATRSVERKK